MGGGACCYSVKQSEKGFGGGGKGDGETYMCDILLPCAPRSGTQKWHMSFVARNGYDILQYTCNMKYEI